MRDAFVLPKDRTMTGTSNHPTHFQPLAPVTLETTQGKIEWGNLKNWVLFAGPDIIEDEGLVLEVAQELKKLTTKLGCNWAL